MVQLNVWFHIIKCVICVHICVERVTDCCNFPSCSHWLSASFTNTLTVALLTLTGHMCHHINWQKSKLLENSTALQQKQVCQFYKQNYRTTMKTN